MGGRDTQSTYTGGSEYAGSPGERLLVITTVPWNLCFWAREVWHLIDVSRVRGIDVRAGHEAEVRRLEWWLLRLALGGHLASAVVVAAVTFVSGHYFAAFYLLSCAMRPTAYLGYLRTRLARLSAEIKALRDGTDSAQERAFRELDGVRDDLRGDSARLREDLRLARESFEGDRETLRERIAVVERRVAGVLRHFDAAVDGLTEQQELLNGIRAFLRLVRADAVVE